MKGTLQLAGPFLIQEMRCMLAILQGIAHLDSKAEVITKTRLRMQPPAQASYQQSRQHGFREAFWRRRS